MTWPNFTNNSKWTDLLHNSTNLSNSPSNSNFKEAAGTPIANQTIRHLIGVLGCVTLDTIAETSYWTY